LIIDRVALFPLHHPPHPPSCRMMTTCETLTEDQSLTPSSSASLSTAIVKHMRIPLMW
jgi:hypothetical protein